MSQQQKISINRSTWYKSMNGQRIFVIVGIWYANDPVNEQVELLELYKCIPIIHSRKDFTELIEVGELVRV